jgi:cell division septum initiation protein DivIVA
MTDQSLRRADELLTELVEQVETARALPMSSSCVLPRERMLDLLDEFREVLPPEIDEARRIIANRDALLHDAYAEATSVREKASAEAETMAANATARAAELVHDAEVQAYQIVEQGKVEHATLVSATTIHQSAARSAAELREQTDLQIRDLQQAAEDYSDRLRGEADRYAADLRADAERYATRLISDSEDYADRTLYDLATTLQRAAATADQGRIALAQRRGQGPDAQPSAEVPAPDGYEGYDSFASEPGPAEGPVGADTGSAADEPDPSAEAPQGAQETVSA